MDLSNAFRDRYQKVVDRLPTTERQALLAETKSVHLPGNVPPWTDTEMVLSKGDRVTWLADGRVVVSEELGVWGGPCFFLWGRVGESGTIFKAPGETLTFEAPADGKLFLATYQGEWGTRDGKLATPVEAYETVGGAIDVFLLRWRAEPRTALVKLATLAPEDALLHDEAERLASPVAAPAGWKHLWFLGESDIFRPAEKGIEVHTQEDVGILQKPVAFDLAPDTTLSWRWKVDQLPSEVAEDTFPTHDYLSIAVEFENGLDLTYYWSAELPEGTHFACPLPTWMARETHMVIRSGSSRLGEWLGEKRNVFDDYKKAIGPEPPKRIVAVWLIAVSLFRHGEGRAEFSDIELVGGGKCESAWNSDPSDLLRNLLIQR